MAQNTRHGPGPRMSAGVIHNSVVYLAGQLGTTAADAYGQTAATLEKVDRLFKECESDKTALLHVTVHLANIDDFASMNRAWGERVAAGEAPARVTVEARLARPTALVKITVIAAHPD